MHATTPKGNMGYDQYTVPNDCSCRTHFCRISISTREHMSVASGATLSNFFGEQGRQNHPQYLSGLSCALFPTTFLKTAVYGHGFYELSRMLMRRNVNNDVSKDLPID